MDSEKEALGVLFHQWVKTLIEKSRSGEIEWKFGNGEYACRYGQIDFLSRDNIIIFTVHTNDNETSFRINKRMNGAEPLIDELYSVLEEKRNG